ncbi:MAG TPA: cytochrome c3 family protein [Ignavibacteriaceae bacterium]|nr:cytochrome c3 family protein [Ignavibacteriaceae bacterium]
MLIIFFSAFCNNIFAANDECISCHEAIGDEAAAKFKEDIHFKKGISCADCHGGDKNSDDQEIAMGTKNFIGVPKGNLISDVCARCHSSREIMKRYGSDLPVDQYSLLESSVHGKISISGNERIVQCITCHNAHGIVHVKNILSPVYALNIINTCSKCHSNSVYMRKYNPSLPIDQLEKYRTSIHGILNAKGNVKAAECVSCHGSHDIKPAEDVNSKVYAAHIPGTCASCHSDKEYMKEFKIPTDQFEKYSSSVHGIALLQKNDLNAPACNDCHGNHGAIPPGIESISSVCGTCHVLNAELFSSSPHKKAFDSRNLPECETCHGNHAIVNSSEKLLGVDNKAVCSKCHTENVEVKGYNSAKIMRRLMDSLSFEEKRAISLIEDAEQKGMEVSEAKFKLRDVRQAKLELRTVIHSFNENKFREAAVDKGLKVSGEIIKEADDAIDEYYFRRFGLGAATLIISVVVISLYLIIRRKESTKVN